MKAVSGFRKCVDFSVISAGCSLNFYSDEAFCDYAVLCIFKAFLRIVYYFWKYEYNVCAAVCRICPFQFCGFFIAVSPRRTPRIFSVEWFSVLQSKSWKACVSVMLGSDTGWNTWVNVPIRANTLIITSLQRVLTTPLGCWTRIHAYWWK